MPYAAMFYHYLQESIVPRSAALWFYRQATSSRRRELWLSLAESARFPIGILFYHRVADSHPTHWTISRDDFCRHLDWLQAHFELTTLAECQRLIREGRNSRRAISITFDDGYAENCDFAIPELKRRGIPMTYFVATDFIERGHAFPHDDELGLKLRPNSISEIQDIAREGFTIGAHTRSHVNSAKLRSEREITEEILGGAELLRKWTKTPVRYFSFPYGLPEHISQAAVNLLPKFGFDGFCSAYGAWNWPGKPGYHLRRIHADPGLESLKNWLTLDPRKLDDHAPLMFTEPLLAAEHSPATESILV